jgi:regulator of protease activity HflC (stomatin/prohibitin superfamily)
MDGSIFVFWLCLGVALCVTVMGLRVVQQYQRLVVLRLGRYTTTRQAGLTWLIPGVEVGIKVDLRTITVPVQAQETITQDNVPIKVSTVVWYRVIDAFKVITEVQSAPAAVVQVALTTLRSVMGQHKMDEVLKSQEAIAAQIKNKIDVVTEPWGVRVERVEMSNVEIPDSMQRVMAQEAEAVREKRARIIKAEAEKEAAVQLAEAAALVTQNPLAMELRRMQMIAEVGAEQNTTTIIMMPSEFVAAAGAIARGKSSV